MISRLQFLQDAKDFFEEKLNKAIETQRKSQQRITMPFYILFRYGMKYAVIGCEHSQHAVNKAAQEFGRDTWTGISAFKPNEEFWKFLSNKEMREWLRKIQS